jgi:hypothetical protein
VALFFVCGLHEDLVTLRCYIDSKVMHNLAKRSALNDGTRIKYFGEWKEENWYSEYHMKTEPQN